VQKGIIFDLDGTLVNSLDGLTSSLNAALLQAGLPTHSLAAVRGFIGNGAKILITRAAPVGSDEALLDGLAQAFSRHYDEHWSSGTVPYDGIRNLLKTLQEQAIPLNILSNKPHAFTLAIVKYLFPEISFSVVLGQQDGVPHKPAPDGALKIAELISRLPADCIVIGDSTMDLETATNAGMQSIAVSWGFHDRDRLVAAGAMRIADDPEMLLAMLR
jgi:phosphoglycolate phosphatase